MASPFWAGKPQGMLWEVWGEMMEEANAIR
jgi:hypothetical protein